MSISSRSSRFFNHSSSDTAPVSPTGQVPYEMPLFPGYIKPNRQPKPLSYKKHPYNRDMTLSDASQSGQQPNDEMRQLHTQIEQIRQQHTTEMAQLEAAWQQRLDSFIEQYASSATDISTATPAMPRLSLGHVATTYEVPRRLRLSWVEKSLGAIPTFLLLVGAGMVLAALSAIALSPTVLWPSVSFIIRSMVPTVFVVGLCSFFAIAAWNVGQ